jgi:hypothetical protein
LERRLIGDAGDARLDPLQRLALRLAGEQPDREIDAAGEQFGIDDMPADRALHRDRLEILAAPLHEQRHFAIVQRYLGNAGGGRPEPEDETTPGLPHAAVAVADDVVACLALEQCDEAEVADRGHDEASCDQSWRWKRKSSAGR